MCALYQRIFFLKLWQMENNTRNSEEEKSYVDGRFILQIFDTN